MLAIRTKVNPMPAHERYTDGRSARVRARIRQHAARMLHVETVRTYSRLIVREDGYLHWFS